MDLVAYTLGLDCLLFRFSACLLTESTLESAGFEYCFHLASVWV